jgi:hypothetical protein
MKFEDLDEKDPVLEPAKKLRALGILDAKDGKFGGKKEITGKDLKKLMKVKNL